MTIRLPIKAAAEQPPPDPISMTICLPALDAALSQLPPLGAKVAKAVKDPEPCLTLCIPSARWNPLVKDVTKANNKAKLESTVDRLSQTAMEDALVLIQREKEFPVEEAVAEDSEDDWCDIQERCPPPHRNESNTETRRDSSLVHIW